MSIEKLEEFARDGQKNTDELILTDGFPRPKFPARQWFNYLFNMLSLKINELIDLDPISKTEIVDNLTTDDAAKPVSAKQAKKLNDNKLGKTENAASATKLATDRNINGVAFDGTKDIEIPMFGVGQSTKPVTRIVNTEYTNPTNKTIVAYFTIKVGTYGTSTGYCDSEEVGRIYCDVGSGGSVVGQIAISVPPNSKYKIIGGQILKSSELS